MKFYYEGNLVRESKTRTYTHGVLMDRNGMSNVVSCHASKTLAEKAMNTYHIPGAMFSVVELTTEKKEPAQDKGLVAIIVYTNSNLKEISKGFTNLDEAWTFSEKLDERCQRGTCGGYCFTVL